MDWANQPRGRITVPLYTATGKKPATYMAFIWNVMLPEWLGESLDNLASACVSARGDDHCCCRDFLVGWITRCKVIIASAFWVTLTCFINIYMLINSTMWIPSLHGCLWWVWLVFLRTSYYGHCIMSWAIKVLFFCVLWQWGVFILIIWVYI